jgi:hypothetical protein
MCRIAFLFADRDERGISFAVAEADQVDRIELLSITSPKKTTQFRLISANGKVPLTYLCSSRMIAPQFSSFCGSSQILAPLKFPVSRNPRDANAPSGIDLPARRSGAAINGWVPEFGRQDNLCYREQR